MTDSKHNTDHSKPPLYRGNTAEQWRDLFKSAALFQKLEPWQWIKPTDFFGIQLGEDEQIAFICVMGVGLPNHAFFAFLGWEALARVRSLIMRRSLTIRNLIETPTLQLTFVKQAELGELDRDLAELGGYKGQKGVDEVPVFRSHHTGYLPWLLEGDEVGRLTEILRQTVGMALRLETDDEILRKGGQNEVLVLSRLKDGEWAERWRPIPSMRSFQKEAEIDPRKLSQVLRLPKKSEKIQFDLAMSKATVGNPGERLRTTYLLAAFDSDDGECLGADVVLPDKGIESMWGSVPNRFLSLCLHAGFRPREIEVRSNTMMNALRPLLGRLPIKLTFHSELGHYDKFLEGMNNVAEDKDRKTDEQ